MAGLSKKAIYIGLLTFISSQSAAIGLVIQTEGWLLNDLLVGILGGLGAWCSGVVMYLRKAFDSDGDGVLDSDEPDVSGVSLAQAIERLSQEPPTVLAKVAGKLGGFDGAST